MLNESHAGDAAQMLALLGQVKGVIASVTTDSAYNGELTEDTPKNYRFGLTVLG